MSEITAADTTRKKIKRYAIIVMPSRKDWRLLLELEDNAKADPIRFESASELAAMLDVLRHSRHLYYYLEDGLIESTYVEVGESAGKHFE